MKTRLIIVLLILIGSTVLVYAQSKEIMAKSAMLNAENSYEKGNYKECLDFLNEAVTNLGNTNSRVQYLKVKTLIAMGNLDQNSIIIWAQADEELKKYFEVTSENKAVPEKYDEMVMAVIKVKKYLSEAEQKHAKVEAEVVVIDPANRWMGKNLDVDHFRNGDAIRQVQSEKEWQELTTGAWCYYNNDPSNDVVYGKLYNWYAVDDARGLCPAGWHVPNLTDWKILEETLGGDSKAGGKLKETGTLHWADPNAGATNEYGFNALPGGHRGLDGIFSNFGKEGFWWSSSEYSSGFACNKSIFSESTFLHNDYNFKSYGYSVRCVKDN